MMPDPVTVAADNDALGYLIIYSFYTPTHSSLNEILFL
jgi:hypothetical protein